MRQISAVIITYNEQEKISKCLKSLESVADEIIVVDSFSTDRTGEICLTAGVRFVQRAFTGFIDQKNFAITLARHELILSLDADEYLSTELIKSILELKKDGHSRAYAMNRLSSYCGKWIRHGSWYPDRKVRLWEKTSGRFGGKVPHELVCLDPGVETVFLNGDILHESFRDVGEALRKIDLYSKMFADHYTGKRLTVFSAPIHGISAFFKSYFIKKGFLDGYPGFAVAAIQAAHAYFKYERCYEKGRQVPLKK